MAAVIEFNGVRLTVPVSELGAAVLELRRVGVLPGQVSKASMTNAEARPLSPVQTQPDLVELAEREARFSAGVPRKASEIKSAWNFLAMVARLNSANKRAETPAALEIFAVKHSKGLGSKLAAVNRLLDVTGFALPDVYTTERDAHGSYWKAGPRIAEAITALAEKALAAEGSERDRPEMDNTLAVSNEQIEKEDVVQPQHNEKSP